MDVANNNNSISRSERYPIYKDYQAMLDHGYDLVAQYSSAVWTNYNDSDPGITVLQNLCYALTELGNKADLPTGDILSSLRGKIIMKDQFHLPAEVFPVNPVTFGDFSKLLIDEIPELKQVYFRTVFSSFACDLELRPEYIGSLKGQVLFSSRLEAMVENLLRRHSNLSQVFNRPTMLTPALVHLQGSITIDTNVAAEMVMAGIIFRVNNYFSSYPVFQSYTKLVDDGRLLAELMTGPLLSGGYIDDQYLSVKRDTIQLDDISVAVQGSGVAEVQLTGVSYNVNTPGTPTLQVSIDEAPYVSLQSFGNTQIIQNGRIVGSFDASKVDYYLSQLMPARQPSGLNSLLPTGTPRAIHDYYSIQNSFPAIYQLTGKGPAEAAHQSKVKQLKGYLFLFEQLMGDYLMQLEKTPELFSFRSGHTNHQLTSTTYFAQPLYGIPGADKVLHGVEGHRYINEDLDTSTDWSAYRADEKNPYQLMLNVSSSDRETDLDRKLRALQHLAARHGISYEHKPLHFANVQYGTDQVAEVDYLSDTLINFPLLSANLSRTYFKTGMHQRLVSGLQLNLANELGLRSFFHGTREAILQGLAATPPSVLITYYDAEGGERIVFPEAKKDWAIEVSGTPRNWVEIRWNDETLLSFHSHRKLHVMSVEEAIHFVSPYVDELKQLADHFDGCLVVDFARLAEFLKFRWWARDKQGNTVYTSREMSLKRVMDRLAYLDGKQTLEIKEVIPGVDYEIGAMTNQRRHLVCDGILSLDEAQRILDALNSATTNPDTFLGIDVVDYRDRTQTYPIKNLLKRVMVFLPEWVTAFQQPGYRQLIGQKLLALTPLCSVSELRFLSLSVFHQTSESYAQWMDGLEEIYNGSKPARNATVAAERLTNFLIQEPNAGADV